MLWTQSKMLKTRKLAKINGWQCEIFCTWWIMCSISEFRLDFISVWWGASKITRTPLAPTVRWRRSIVTVACSGRRWEQRLHESWSTHFYVNICELDWKALNLTFAILDTRSPCDEGNTDRWIQCCLWSCSVCWWCLKHWGNLRCEWFQEPLRLKACLDWHQPIHWFPLKEDWFRALIEPMQEMEERIDI